MPTADVLRAGAAKVDITPPLGVPLAGHFEARYATDIDDPLTARALVLECGGVRIALVQCDLICLPDSDVAAARACIAARAGVPAEHVMLGATHTHTAPSPTALLGTPRADAYMAALPERIATAVAMAAARLRPARAGAETVPVGGVSFCRRFHMSDGTVRMNPGRANPDALLPASPVDPALLALYVEDAATCAPLALWANFSLHYVGTDDAEHVSADYFGRFARIVESALGGGVAILSNGAQGQINNIDVHDRSQASGHRQSERVARAVAGGALTAAGRARMRDRIALCARTATVHLDRRDVTSADLKAAARILAAPAGGRPADLPSPTFHWVRGQDLPDGLLRTYASEVEALSRWPKRVAAEVQALRIGDASLVGLPGEPFVELGLAIKAASPGERTAVVGLANGYVGYIPTREAYDQGGYETWAARSAPLAPGSGEALVAAASDAVRAVFDPA